MLMPLAYNYAIVCSKRSYAQGLFGAKGLAATKEIFLRSCVGTAQAIADA